MRYTLLLLLTTLLSCKSDNLTDTQRELKGSFIDIKSLSKLNIKIYKSIKEYEIIMIGEMHGTQEPAEFAYGLCNLISKHEEKVIMAMEISPRQMDGYHDKMSWEELKQLVFFHGENTSGMNGQAWLNLIHQSNQNDNIEIKFFDYQRVAPRDSSMYNAITEIHKANPNTKIVTLSGNLHNRLGSFNGNLMLGGYLMRDTINFNPDKIMSVMHYYNHGTMLNNIGNGLELTNIEPKDDIFNQVTSSKMLFCPNPFEDRNYFTHVIYTDEVTHSEVVEVEEVFSIPN